jgi:DNA-directed RNA polymerase subunit beta
MDKIFVNNIGDLVEAQRASFYRFLSIGISEELKNFSNPFLAKIKPIGKKKRIPCLVYLYPNEIKLKGPNFNVNHCLKNSLSYSIQLYVTAEYYEPNQNKYDKRIRIKKDILFGELPLMTEEGTFVINGCERVIISQIIRSPGIYFRKEYLGISRKISFTATLISNKGLWTKIILDEKPKKKTTSKTEIQDNDNDLVGLDRIYFHSNSLKIKENKKDCDTNKIFIFDILRYFGLNFQEISDSLKYPSKLSNIQYTAREDFLLKEFYNGNIVGNYDTSKQVKQLIFNNRASSFSIGQIGRYKINKRLGLNLPKNITYLTGQDLIKIIDGLIDLKYFNRINDDIDDIRNKQIRCLGDLLQNQLRAGLSRLEKAIKEDSYAAQNQKMNFDFETYIDPEHWIIDPRPLTTTIKEFFKTSQLSQFMDQINPLSELTHKRRISVFGPNGLKRDHISTDIRDIHPSQYGRLCPVETPEGQNAGLITSLSMLGRISSLGSIETPYFLVQDSKVYSTKRPIFLNPEQESETKVAFADISLNKFQQISQNYLSAKENYSFTVKKVDEINFLTISPLQIISFATALIPFIEHDDANRALMGSNMQRQAVPLLYTQKPIVGTGFESIAPLDSSFVIKNYSEGFVTKSSSSEIVIKDLNKQSIKYFLKKYYRSNQETAMNQKPIVWIGEEVFSGQIIADGPSTNDGELALGRNLTLAYMPWEGYNYEDAIVINERLITEDSLTSIHIEEYETNVTYQSNGMEKLTNNLPHLSKFVKRHLNKNGIVKIGSYVKEHDILVGKMTPCEEDNSPESKLIRALYYNDKKEEPRFRDTSLKVPHGTEGRVVDIRIIVSPVTQKEENMLSTASQNIRIFIAQIRKVKIGDKLAGRHGNKGIVSRILPRQDMPYLPDGTPIDIIFNPLGVPSRMNVGQVFECLLGLAGENLGKRFKVIPFDEIYGVEASRILVNQKLKEASIKTGSNWLYNPYYIGKILLRDGRTGEFFDNPITVGKSYILKLIHLVEDKIHARATGPYSMITEQPLAGKSQKGGQRFGEMEVWALEAYGCSNSLQELLTIKSDDIDGRNDMYEAILMRKDYDKPNPSIPESFLALIRELNALGLDFSLKKFEGGFYSTTDINETEKDIFNELEIRLKLRALLARKKVEEYAKKIKFTEKIGISKPKKLKNKKNN